MLWMYVRDVDAVRHLHSCSVLVVDLSCHIGVPQVVAPFDGHLLTASCAIGLWFCEC